MFYLNGQFLDEEIAISIRDRGLLLGDGLFETILCKKGICIALANHWHRLLSGAKYLSIPINFTMTDISHAIGRLLQKNRLDHCDAVVRITLTRGVGTRGLAITHLKQPSLLITCDEYHAPKEKSIRLSFTPNLANEHCPLHTYKTLNYLDKITAKHQAAQKGFDDTLLLNSKRHVVGTSCANIFFIHDNDIFTPAVSSGCLPGITRAYILEICKHANIKCMQKHIPYEQTPNLESAFITNSLIGIMPVSQIDQVDFDIDHQLIQKLKKHYYDIIHPQENLSNEKVAARKK